MTNRSSTLFKLFAHPAAVFIYAFLFALIAVAIADRFYQLIAIISIGAAYSAVSLFYLIWKEKVSAQECQIEKERLQEQLTRAQDEANGLREENEELKAEIPKVIRYKSIRKEIVIKDREGNADFLMEYEGNNISGRPINRVRHLLALTENKVFKKNTAARFNGEEVTPQVKSDPLGDPTYAWRTEIYLETTSPVLPEVPFRTGYRTFLEKEYQGAFDPEKKAVTAHQVALRTDELSTEMTAPRGFVFHPNPEIQVKDVFTALPVPEEETRILSERAVDINSTRTKLTFKIKSPKISYDYRLFFKLAELSKIEEEA